MMILSEARHAHIIPQLQSLWALAIHVRKLGFRITLARRRVRRNCPLDREQREWWRCSPRDLPVRTCSAFPWFQDRSLLPEDRGTRVADSSRGAAELKPWDGFRCRAA